VQFLKSNLLSTQVAIVEISKSYLNAKQLLVLFTVSFCRKVAGSNSHRTNNLIHVLPGVQNSRKNSPKFLDSTNFRVNINMKSIYWNSVQMPFWPFSCTNLFVYICQGYFSG